MIRGELIRLGKGSIIYGNGGVLQRFMALLLLLLFIRALTPEDYEVLVLINTAVLSYVYVVYGLSLTATKRDSINMKLI